MLRDELRFYHPASREDEVTLARTRVRERSEGLKVTTLLFGGCAFAGTTFAIAARIGGGPAVNLVPAVAILVALPSAGLAIVAISSLIWRGRLRRLTGIGAPGHIQSSLRRVTHGRRRIRFHHRLLFWSRRRAHGRPPTPVKRAA